jgi:ATP-dependent DNA helicase RecQ
LMKLLRIALGDIGAGSCGHCSVCLVSHSWMKKIDSEVFNINTWLKLRSSSISFSSKNQLREGVAILNAQIRSPLFIEFMRSRAVEPIMLNHELLELIKYHLIKLQKNYSFGSVISLPSRTWLARNQIAQLIADALGVKLLSDYLQWKTVPQARQGELLNNDQRRHNIDHHMQGNYQDKVPQGDILLLDDYIGSGVTLQEAARVLYKEAKVHNLIVPFTIATVRWRLGKPGMI